MAVEKSDELAIVGRGHVVVDRAEILMIGNVQRVGSEAEVMVFPVLAFPERYPKCAIRLEVE